MTSKVLDLATVAHALNELSNTFNQAGWGAINDEQREFLDWYADHSEEIAALGNLEALASTDYVELNQFLTARGFPALFSEFKGLGVASVLDMLLEWIEEGYATTLSRSVPVGEHKNAFGQKSPVFEDVSYPAFRVDAGVYDVAGYPNPLVRLRAKNGHSLWLMKADEPASGIALNRAVLGVLGSQMSTNRTWANSAIVPMLEIDTDGDVAWLTGMRNADYYVAQVFQKFKLRANEKGARVKVATGMIVALAACAPTPQPYVLNDPFIGFFTQAGHDTLPLAAFWADTDVWRVPAGTLEEL